MTFHPRQLRAFLAIVESGSLGRAAESLHLSQPALSRIVKRLETQLQAQLFERHSTGMELTSFGQALLPYATHLSTETNLAIEEINALRGLGRGTIRVGAVASAAIMLLPEVLNRILSRWPSLQVQVVEAVEDKLALALSHNDIDVALAGPIPESQDIQRVAEHKFGDRHAVITSVSHPLQRRKDLSISDLAGMAWVMPPDEAEPRRQFNSLVKRLGAAAPHVTIETRSPSVIKAIVARTLFLGWLPEPLFAAEQASGLIRPLAVREMNMERRFFVYRRRRSFTSPAMSKFLEELNTVNITRAKGADA
jgi:DNA-binding transcriptional LysR family regulator